MTKNKTKWEIEINWIGIAILILIIGAVITGKRESNEPPIPKEKAVIVEVVRNHDYKVKFADGTTNVVSLQKGFIAGDTVLIKK